MVIGMARFMVLPLIQMSLVGILALKLTQTLQLHQEYISKGISAKKQKDVNIKSLKYCDVLSDE